MGLTSFTHEAISYMHIFIKNLDMPKMKYIAVRK
jgi:hypothetical protein